MRKKSNQFRLGKKWEMGQNYYQNSSPPEIDFFSNQAFPSQSHQPISRLTGPYSDITPWASQCSSSVAGTHRQPRRQLFGRFASWLASSRGEFASLRLPAQQLSPLWVDFRVLLSERQTQPKRGYGFASSRLRRQGFCCPFPWFFLGIWDTGAVSFLPFFGALGDTSKKSDIRLVRREALEPSQKQPRLLRSLAVPQSHLLVKRAGAWQGHAMVFDVYK